MEDLERHCQVVSFETTKHDIFNPEYSSFEEDTFQELRIEVQQEESPQKKNLRCSILSIIAPFPKKTSARPTSSSRST